jgi:transketolase
VGRTRRFILSKGHACAALYAALALRGFFPLETLSTFRQFGSILQGHPDMKKPRR